MVKIKQGLDVPILGAPEQTIVAGNNVSRVALVGFDYIGMKPTMAVSVGDTVKLGQELFEDKKTPGVKYTSPAAGKVVAINRGEKRVFQSIVIELAGSEAVEFPKYPAQALGGLTRQQVVDNLVASGQWTALRTRPFSKVPAIDSTPHSIFVTAMDTNPLAADPAVIITQQIEAFNNGLIILSHLSDGPVFVCKHADASIQVNASERIRVEEFAGKHPAGNAGTHIHFLDPVGANKTVWTIGYQDAIAIGHLFVTGRLFVERVLSLAGPMVKKPRLIRSRLGACISELVDGELKQGDCRKISGSILGGRSARSVVDYVGRYANQITVLEEGYHREFMGWLSPGINKFSVMNIYLSKLFGGKRFNMTTTTNGSERAMVPVGAYEGVMPLDILPTQLLRALIVGDTEQAQLLGCLELDEEDLALCTFVCPGKYEYGPILRDNLTQIEKDG